MTKTTYFSLLLSCTTLGACGSMRTQETMNVATDGGTVEETPQGECQLYLSCLLASTPTAYAAALALYGDTSPCWHDAQTSASCTQACTSAYKDISASCQCTGTTCSTCAPAPVTGTYSGPQDQSDCLLLDSPTQITSYGRTATIEINYQNFDGPFPRGSLSINPTWACTGPTTVMTKTTSTGCTQISTIVITPATDTSTVQLSVSNVYSCGTDPPTTCAGSATITAS